MVLDNLRYKPAIYGKEIWLFKSDSLGKLCTTIAIWLTSKKCWSDDIRFGTL